MSLLNNLVAFWRFEEAATTAVDESGNGHDLTWNVSGRTPPGGAPVVNDEPQRTTGKIGYGLDLNDSYIWATVADWNELQDTSFTFAGWIKPQSPTIGSNDMVLSLLGDYELDWDEVQARFTWTVYKQGGGSVTVNSGTVTRNEWHFLRAWLDLDEGIIAIEVDCGTIYTEAWTGSLNNNTGGQCEFCFGRDGQSFAFAPHQIDAWGLWTTVLDPGDAALLCPGIEYPFIDCGRVIFGAYTFANTFYPAEDGVEWSPAMSPLVRAHGGRALDFYQRPRRVLVKGGEIKGPFNTSDLRDRIDDIRVALQAQPQNLWIDPDRYFRRARVEYFRNPYGPTHYCRIAADMEISFLLEDPFKYGIALNTDTWTGPTNAATHALTTVGGNVFARPSAIEFVIGGGGAQTIDWTLENTTTGESFQLAGAVTGGQTIIVNCLDMTVLIGTTDEISLFDGEFLTLDVGANSYTITITSGSITSITTRWRSRFL